MVIDISWCVLMVSWSHVMVIELEYGFGGVGMLEFIDFLCVMDGCWLLICPCFVYLFYNCSCICMI